MSTISYKKVLLRIFDVLRDVARRDDRISAREFIEKAFDFGISEIEASKLALKRSSRDDIKYFAKTSLQGHMGINSGLTRIATQKNIKSVFEVGLVINARRVAFEHYDVKLFDELYVKNRIEVYERMIIFLQQVCSSDDREIALFAQEILPMFFSYLGHARELERRPLVGLIEP